LYWTRNKDLKTMTTQASHSLSREELEEAMIRRRKRTEGRDAKRDEVMRMVFARPGFAMVIAKKLGLSHQAVSAWTKVPPHHVIELAPLLKLSPEAIRPDIFKRRRK